MRPRHVHVPPGLLVRSCFWLSPLVCQLVFLSLSRCLKLRTSARGTSMLKRKMRCRGGTASSQLLRWQTLPRHWNATNKSYYEHVQSDCSTILKHFGDDFLKAFPLAITPEEKSGVQDCFDKTKCAQALSAHGVYRASVSIWWFNCLSFATPFIHPHESQVCLGPRSFQECCEKRFRNK